MLQPATPKPEAVVLTIPLRTVSGLNAREHWRARAKRVEAERFAVRVAIVQRFGVRIADAPKPPCVVKLTRIGPTNGLDPFDNLPSSLKGCVDEISNWLGVNDRKSDLVQYECGQERGKEWAVRVEITA
ncbi:MAG: hypothetical protein JWQ89_3693 [Devosia sp.]|uniref:hypothetical protein n=1 Tax=Devosia sp. TaxID=1871048 RepID=UPI00262E6CEB|nr:hypothetical protein [Devosia sp.]MDB5541966.1 hypothetical protein [Devosia sp.]